jgi:TRAP-type C4-dicarboxylate transport system substrate-binding protein
MESRKSLLIVGTILLTLLVLMATIAGCSKETTTPAQTQTPTPTTTPVQPITLKMAPGGLPNAEALFGGIPEWAAEVEKRTQGRVKIDVYYGETLAKSRENIDALKSGLADIIFPAPHHAPGKLPLFTIGNVAGLTDDYWAKAMAFYELLSTEQALIDEFAAWDGVNLGAAYYPPVGLISKTPYKTLAELKGIKIAAASPASDLLSKFGAAPMNVMPAEQYEGLMRGTVDANASPVAAIIDFKFYEIAKNFTTFNLGDRNHGLFINKNALARLSSQDQKILLDLAPDYTKIAYDACATGLVPRGTDQLKQAGVQFIAPTAADAASLIEAAKSLAEAWVKEMDGKGLPGTQLMNKYKELIKKYEAISPYKK